MRLSRPAAILALAAALVAPLSVEAHRAWLLPSATVLSGNEPWVTVDAAIANGLFEFDHQPMRLDDLKILAPGGGEVAVENAATGRFRSTFDVKLDRPGTYRIVSAGDYLFASYEQNGERKRWRGTAETLKSGIPADAQNLQVRAVQRRIETYVTAGSPDESVFTIEGRGLELKPVTHPNDLFAGEEARFVLLLDGEPAADIAVEVIPGGTRYRDREDKIDLRTDAQGQFAVTWPAAGMYWISAEVEDDKAGIPEAQKRHASFIATLEVLPQ